MSEKEKVVVNDEGIVLKNQFTRNDGVNPSSDFSNSLVKKFVLVEEVHLLDEKNPKAFSVELVPECVDEYDIDKVIHEDAKGVDLKSQIRALLKQGLSVSEIYDHFEAEDSDYGDAGLVVNDSVDPLMDLSNKVPDALKGLSSDQLDALIKEIQNVKNEKSIDDKKVSKETKEIGKDEKEKEVKVEDDVQLGKE